jgi:hypothetical protein
MREAQVEDFDRSVGEAMSSHGRGAVLLLEVVPPWPLQVLWLEEQLHAIAPRCVLHHAGDAVLAVLLPDVGLAEAYTLKERLAHRALVHRLQLFVGLASWPVQGSSPMDVVAAAAASLLDAHASHQSELGDEVLLDLDGLSVAMGSAGELLTG